MTAAIARLIVHRACRCRTMDDIRRVGDRMGVDRSLPYAIYRREWVRRYMGMTLLANTVPYIGTGRGIVKN